MIEAQSLRLEASSSPSYLTSPHLTQRVLSIVLATISLFLFAAVLTASSREQAVPLNLLLAVGLVLSTIMIRHIRFLLQLRSQQRKVFSDLELTTHDRRLIERQLVANRALARSASAEAEALRTTALALTTDWQFDQVLDMLLESLAQLVPYEVAKVLLLEDSSRLFVARETIPRQEERSQPKFPLTLDLAGFPLLKRILKEQNPIVLADATKDSEWRQLLPSAADTRSWLCIPLVAGDRSLGILCADHSQAGVFTSEHLRVSRSLALSAAAAIQNARLYEQAQIYGSELEKRLSDLRHTQRALEQAEEQRLVSEDKFHSVFRSSPVAFSITTLEEGRFLDVNEAFEQRYGYTRAELIERTLFELNFWEDRADRAFLIAQLKCASSVRNLVTRLRTKSGELKLTAYSASRIRFDGHPCVLAVSGDIPQIEAGEMN
jgi:PAS domain S-box-containing protein